MWDLYIFGILETSSIFWYNFIFTTPKKIYSLRANWKLSILDNIPGHIGRLGIMEKGIFNQTNLTPWSAAFIWANKLLLLCAVLKSHWLQEYFTPSCTYFTCLYKCALPLASNSHRSQLNLTPSCSDLTCIPNVCFLAVLKLHWLQENFLGSWTFSPILYDYFFGF